MDALRTEVNQTVGVILMTYYAFNGTMGGRKRKYFRKLEKFGVFGLDHYHLPLLIRFVIFPPLPL
jgi:hypothetical protein